MKRSRRVVLTLMGTAAVGAVSMGFVRRDGCSPGRVAEGMRQPDGRFDQNCRVSYGGFGTAPARFHFHGGGS
jgi:hypothetical protein